ncbi:MAG: aryl-sulfate sulfotransferase [Proteobacteria bacterium]|nr:aryl-sulfate sulfotransferase [Pseudomonadota bacterium]
MRPRPWLALLILCASCGDEPISAPTADGIEELRALGYLEASPNVADPSESGARVLDPARVMPGYRLYVADFRCEASLIDVDGRVVHRWRRPPCWKWMHAELLENGDLLVPEVANEREGQERGKGHALLRLDWSGDVVWRVPVDAHHDVETTAEGEILTLTRHSRTDHDLDAGEDTVLVDNAVTRLSAEGSIVDSLSLWDVTRSNDAGFALQPVKARPKSRTIDLFHANAVHALRRPEPLRLHRLYEPGNVLVSSRQQDAILVIDVARRVLVWAWGKGVISGPHDAQMLDDGHFLIFDNGLDRGWSRVLELDPVTEEVVWSYSGDKGSRFFTAQRGGAQRLPNGNTLVSVSNEGQAFEVTPDGEVVWRFGNPELNEDGRREIINRMILYETGFIDALLAR